MQAREPIVSNIERKCVLDLLLNKKRIDGRKLLEFRKTKISFLEQLGGCLVEVGDTKVFSQVSCDICKPRATRPNEGLFLVNLDFSPMASPSFEADRWNDLAIESNRIIERCLKDSGCVDIESLCIVSGEVVWQIKVDIRVLNHEGNLVDACCISAIAALANFQRPDVTVYASEGKEGNNDDSTIASDRPSYIHGRIKFHSQEERAFVSLNIQHIPVCVSLCFYDKGNVIIADPTRAEENVMEGKLIIAVNNQKQLCTLHMSGGSLILTKEELLSHVHKAAKLCTDVIIAQIKEALKLDEARRTDSSLFSKLKAKLTEHEVPIAPLKECQVKKSDEREDRMDQEPDDITEKPDVDDGDEPEIDSLTQNESPYQIEKRCGRNQTFNTAIPFKGNWKINAPEKINKGKKVDSFEGDEPKETNKTRREMSRNIEKEEIVISSDEDEQVTVVV